MSKSWFYFLFFTFFIFSNISLAQPVPFEKPPIFDHSCEEAQTPADIQECMKERADIAIETLNRIFDQIHKRLPDKESLNNSQNAWIQFKEQECEFRIFFEEEAYRQTSKLECIAKLTERRALSLFTTLAKTDYMTVNSKEENTESTSEE